MKPTVVIRTLPEAKARQKEGNLLILVGKIEEIATLIARAVLTMKKKIMIRQT